MSSLSPASSWSSWLATVANGESFSPFYEMDTLPFPGCECFLCFFFVNSTKLLFYFNRRHNFPLLFKSVFSCRGRQLKCKTSPHLKSCQDVIWREFKKRRRKNVLYFGNDGKLFSFKIQDALTGSEGALRWVRKIDNEKDHLPCFNLSPFRAGSDPI